MLYHIEHFNKTLDFRWNVTYSVLHQNKLKMMPVSSEICTDCVVLAQKPDKILLISNSHG